MRTRYAAFSCRSRSCAGPAGVRLAEDGRRQPAAQVFGARGQPAGRQTKDEATAVALRPAAPGGVAPARLDGDVTALRDEAVRDGGAAVPPGAQGREQLAGHGLLAVIGPRPWVR